MWKISNDKKSDSEKLKRPGSSWQIHHIFTTISEVGDMHIWYELGKSNLNL